MNTKYNIGDFVLYKNKSSFDEGNEYYFGTISEITITSEGIFYKLGYFNNNIREEQIVDDLNEYEKYAKRILKRERKRAKNNYNYMMESFNKERSSKE